MRGEKPGVEVTQMTPEFFLKFRFRVVLVCIRVCDAAALCSTVTMETGLPKDI